jgi:L-asparagine transporter-like permease
MLLVMFSVLLLVGDVLLYVFDIFALSEFLLGLLMVLTIFALGIIAYVQIYLLYQMRRQTFDRPIYLIQESSEE